MFSLVMLMVAAYLSANKITGSYEHIMQGEYLHCKILFYLQ